MADNRKSVIVIGGGVAGLAAAIRLAEEGLAVTLFEKRALLGGRASSFVDQETGERVDNCQHVTMRCCTNLEDFYRRVGVADKIRYYPDLSFLGRDGRISRIYTSPLPAPLHTGPSFLRFAALGLRDKIAVARALIAILRAPQTPALDERSMAEFLASMKQTPRATERFWRTIVVSACNEELDRVSCAIAFKVFRDGFLANRVAYQMGLPTVRLADLYTEPAVRYIEERGGRVRRKEHIDGLEMKDGRIERLRLVDGSEVQADYYVSALQFDLLLKLLPADLVEREPYFGNLRNLALAPITGVHLWFDRPLPAPEAIALLDRRMQWIFNKSRTYARSPDEEPCTTYLGLVVSSARDLAALPKEEIVRLALEEVYECVPEAREARLLKSHVIKERKATFAPVPGSARWRPSQKSPVANLFVAGDWTDTGWPATMEGGVRSGYLAAEKLLETEGRPRGLLQPDLPPEGLARWLVR